MKTKGSIIYRRVLVILIIAILVLPILGVQLKNVTIQERMQIIPRPTQLWAGFIEHKWQSFLEQRFIMRMMSLRSFLILSYNETKHRLFPTRPNDHYVRTREFGYYPVDTIRRLNRDALHYDDINEHYQRAARRLKVLQEILNHHGVALLVVIPPTKAELYPEYIARYLTLQPEIILKRAVSYGDVLEKNGVNVLNVQRIFSEKKSTSHWPFFTTTSFHWSSWAGCTATDEILRKAVTLTGKTFFSIDCSVVDYGRSKGTDADIASILNIFSTDNIIGDAPFPLITPQQQYNKESHKILIIGDSFSDQITYALTQALPDENWSPDWLIRYDSFISRQVIGAEGKVITQFPLQHDAALAEVLTKELVVIEVSDGNIYRDAENVNRMEFGATQVLLSGYLAKTNAGVMDPRNLLTTGWRIFRNRQWRTTGNIASIAVHPPRYGKDIHVMLDVENLVLNSHKPRFLDVFLDGKQIDRVAMPQNRGILDLTIPGQDQWYDSLLTEISLQDGSGKSLDVLLHGIRMINSDVDRTIDKGTTTEALSSTKMSNYAGMRTINLIGNKDPDDISVEGLSDLESNDTGDWRWAIGPKTRIRLYVPPALSAKEKKFLLKLAFMNGVPIPGQTVSVQLNGKDVRLFSSNEIIDNKKICADITLTAKSGVNILEFIYKDWNHGKKNYAAHDPRKLAVVFTNLSLHEERK